MQAAADSSLLHDRALVDQARHGDRAAFDELYRRLAPGTWRFALAVSRDPAVAAGAVVAAFASTLGAPPGTAADVPVRAQLLASARHAAFDPALRTIAVGVQTAPESPVREAFAELPERWRSALWLVVAERLSSHEAGPALGVPAAAVTPLTVRAHAGLGEHVIDAYADAVEDKGCQHAADRLIDYEAGRLTAREAARVRRHLDGCSPCRGAVAVLDDLTPALRQLALPLPIGLAAVTDAHWRSALVPAGGPLGLTWPNGRPVPAWVERTAAGAAAAVIALGIASAVLVAGRGSKVKDDGLARSVAAELPIGDGESAAGGANDLGVLPSTPPSTTAADGGGVQRPLPRSDDSAPVLAPPHTVAPSTPVASPTTPVAPTTPTADVTEPAVEVTVAVDGLLGVTIGDQCTGIDIAGLVIGCAPATTGAPLEIITDGSLLNSLGL